MLLSVFRAFFVAFFTGLCCLACLSSSTTTSPTGGRRQHLLIDEDTLWNATEDCCQGFIHCCWAAFSLNSNLGPSLCTDLSEIPKTVARMVDCVGGRLMAEEDRLSLTRDLHCCDQFSSDDSDTPSQCTRECSKLLSSPTLSKREIFHRLHLMVACRSRRRAFKQCIARKWISESDESTRCSC